MRDYLEFDKTRFGERLLEVSDGGEGFDLSALRRGHGLDNLRDRLAVRFGASARLEIVRRDGRTLVSLAVPHKPGVQLRGALRQPGE